ncbi:MAG TPA: hypothetical protein VGB03_05865, partial [Acidimicrobiales bacterium]
MTLRSLRIVVAVTSVVCVGGMIAGSVAGNNGVALVFGLVIAVAVLCNVVATAVTGGRAPADDEAQAARVEAMVADLVAQGADEG